MSLCDVPCLQRTAAAASLCLCLLDGFSVDENGDMTVSQQACEVMALYSKFYPDSSNLLKQIIPLIMPADARGSCAQQFKVGPHAWAVDSAAMEAVFALLLHMGDASNSSTASVDTVCNRAVALRREVQGVSSSAPAPKVYAAAAAAARKAAAEQRAPQDDELIRPMYLLCLVQLQQHSVQIQNLSPVEYLLHCLGCQLPFRVMHAPSKTHTTEQLAQLDSWRAELCKIPVQAVATWRREMLAGVCQWVVESFSGIDTGEREGRVVH